MANLFLAHARAFCRTVTGLPAAVATEQAETLIDLLASALDSSGHGMTATGSVAEHRRRIVRHIEMNFREPDLNAAFIAAALGVSERYLQKVLHSHGDSVSALIRARRVAEAERLLVYRPISGRAVADIAYDVGFSDLAHFSRVIRRATGRSPSAAGAPAS